MPNEPIQNFLMTPMVDIANDILLDIELIDDVFGTSMLKVYFSTVLGHITSNFLADDPPIDNNVTSICLPAGRYRLAFVPIMSLPVGNHITIRRVNLTGINCSTSYSKKIAFDMFTTVQVYTRL